MLSGFQNQLEKESDEYLTVKNWNLETQQQDTQLTLGNQGCQNCVENGTDKPGNRKYKQ